MPILTGAGNTLLCPRFGYGKRISTRAKSVNSENRHRHGFQQRREPGLLEIMVASERLIQMPSRAHRLRRTHG